MADALNIKPAPNWGGIPYAQGTTFGQPLSPYANWTDQLYAALQPMPTGQQFNRWNFGQQSPPMQQGMPPPGVSGLLGGGTPAQDGAPQAGGYPNAPQAAPAAPMQNIMNANNWAKPTASPMTLQGSSPYVSAFNQLMQTQGPDAAYTYLMKNYYPAGGYGGVGSQLEQQLGSDAFHQLVNAYSAGGKSYYPSRYDFSGLPGAQTYLQQRVAADPRLLGRRAGTRGLLGG